jgi:hypothetical protein
LFDYAEVVDVVGRWWNGLFGRLSRRDIWLSQETRWHVRARQGDADTGRELHWDYATEAEARAMVKRLMSANGPGSWRELTAATKPPPDGRPDGRRTS